jgi:hypothetical protein
MESMLPNPQTPTPAERPLPPLLIGVLLAREIVCSQFNLMNENVAQGKMAENRFRGLHEEAVRSQEALAKGQIVLEARRGWGAPLISLLAGTRRSG